MILLLLKGFRDPVNAIECLPKRNLTEKAVLRDRVSDIAAKL